MYTQGYTHTHTHTHHAHTQIAHTHTHTHTHIPLIEMTNIGYVKETLGNFIEMLK